MPQAPNWTDKATLGVLIVTLVAVICYTRITSHILESDMRAYIKIVPSGQISSASPSGLLQMCVHLHNDGKRFAIATVRSVVRYSPAHLEAPQLPNSTEGRLVWGGDESRPIVAQSEAPLSAVDMASLHSGHGFIYVETEARYEKGSYITVNCWEYPVTTNLRLGEPNICPKAETNCVDEDCK